MDLVMVTVVCPKQFPPKYSLQWVIDLVQCLWLLLSHEYWILHRDYSWISCCCPSLRSRRFGSANWPLHTLYQFYGVNVWVNSEPWIWAWVRVVLVSPLILLPLHYQGQLSCFVQMTGGPGFLSEAAGNGWSQLSCTHGSCHQGQLFPYPSHLGLLSSLDEGWSQQGVGHLSHSHTFRVNSPMPTPSEPTLLCGQDEDTGPAFR